MYKNKHKAQVVILTILTIFVMSSAAWAKAYYVDATNGNDGNSGILQATAWKSIAKINAYAFNPGDSILFKRGEIWNETLSPPSSGTSGKHISFGAYGSGNRPIISSTDGIAIWSKRDYITFENFHIKNVRRYGIVIWHTGVSSTNIIFQDLEVDSAGDVNILIGNADDIIIRRVSSHDCKVQHGLYLDGAVINGTDRPIVEDSMFYNNAGNGIQLNGNNVYRTKNPIIRRCKIYDNGDAGIMDLSSDSGIYSYNLIWDNSDGGIWLHYDTGDDPDGSVSSINAKVYNNVIFTKDSVAWGPGFYVGDKSTLNEFKNNIIYHQDNSDAIFYIETTNVATVDYNYYYTTVNTNWVWGNNWYSSFSSYRSGSGQDDHSADRDPRFTNVSKNEFKLQSSSPCIDAGTDVGLTPSFDGIPVPQGLNSDIGAFEYAEKNIDDMPPAAPKDLRVVSLQP